MSHLHLPALAPRDIIPFLAKGEAHWREGKSAHALATTWMAQPGLPPWVCRVRDTSESFAGAELVDGFFEFESLGERTLKGVAHAMKLYRPIRSRPVRNRFDVALRGCHV